MTKSEDLFGAPKALLGMVHVQALPGTPGHHLPMTDIVDQAVNEARLLIDSGFDAVIVENMHDLPYLRRQVGPEIIAAMTTICTAVRTAIAAPIGIQILAGANHAALAVAHATGANFIRAEGFVFATVADEGLLDEADAGPLLRYRKVIGADNIAILCDIKKKHSSHSLTADLDIAETAKAAAFFGADGLVITGSATGNPTEPDDLAAVRDAVELPILVGSGVTHETVPGLFTHADALIVGSSCKCDGRWDQPIDPKRVELIVAARA